jgi:hypothetical protein
MGEPTLEGNIEGSFEGSFEGSLSVEPCMPAALLGVGIARVLH